MNFIRFVHYTQKQDLQGLVFLCILLHCRIVSHCVGCQALCGSLWGFLGWGRVCVLVGGYRGSVGLWERLGTMHGVGSCTLVRVRVCVCVWVGAVGLWVALCRLLAVGVAVGQGVTLSGCVGTVGRVAGCTGGQDGERVNGQHSGTKSSCGCIVDFTTHGCRGLTLTGMTTSCIVHSQV